MSSNKNLRKQNPVKTMVLLGIMGLLVVALFFVINNRVKPTEEGPAPISAVQELLVQNLDTNYPATPKEVVKMYCEITRCFYSEKYTEDELVELALKSRELFDDELYATQTDEQYLIALQSDIEVYKEADRVISSYSVSSSTDVNEYRFEGRDWAQLYCIYSVREGTAITPVQERFLMRKDEDGHWKILGWQLVEDEEQ